MTGRRIRIGAAVAAVLVAIAARSAELPVATKGEDAVGVRDLDPQAGDQTARIQQALDETHARGGGAVRLGPGRFELHGTLRVPPGVALEGSWTAPHFSYLDRSLRYKEQPQGVPGSPLGTLLLAYAGRGQEDGTALITLDENTVLRGVTMLWPEQQVTNIVAYPYAIRMAAGFNMAVENVTFVNAYQGILCGGEKVDTDCIQIRHVHGCVLRRGIVLDNVRDISPVENIHFNPQYWPWSGHTPEDFPTRAAVWTVCAYTEKNLEAFVFGGNDWVYVLNTFVYGARVGYHFIKTECGVSNGQLVGIGADGCQFAVVIEQTQPQGLQFVNAELVCTRREGVTGERVGIVTGPEFTGSAQFCNTAMWGQFDQILQCRGNGFVSLVQANVVGWAADRPACEVFGGRVQLNGVYFKQPGLHARFHGGVRHAVVSACFAPGGVRVDDRTADAVRLRDNEERRSLPLLATTTPLAPLLALASAPATSSLSNACMREIVADLAATGSVAAAEPVVQCRLQWARDGDALAILADVADVQPIRYERFWEGSSVEFYVAPVEGGEIRQVTILPAVGDEPAECRVFHDGVQQAVEPPPFAVWKTAGGYRLGVSLSLAAMGIADARQPFLFEAKVASVLVPGGSTVTSALAGSRSAYNDSTEFIRLVPESSRRDDGNAK